MHNVAIQVIIRACFANDLRKSQRLESPIGRGRPDRRQAKILSPKKSPQVGIACVPVPEPRSMHNIDPDPRLISCTSNVGGSVDVSVEFNSSPWWVPESPHH